MTLERAKQAMSIAPLAEVHVTWRSAAVIYATAGPLPGGRVPAPDRGEFADVGTYEMHGKIYARVGRTFTFFVPVCNRTVFNLYQNG